MRGAFCLLILFLAFFPAFANEIPASERAVSLRQVFLPQRWTTENGLPQNTITSIVQTRDGYIWLGTFGGLVRFDGVRFTTFNTANTAALRSNRIIKLYEDRDGVLWIGAETGDVVRFQNNVFEIFAEGDNVSTNNFLSFLVDRRGDLWIGHINGVARYEAKSAEKRSFYPLDHNVASIVEDQAGDLWFGTTGRLTRRRGGNLTGYRLDNEGDAIQTNSAEIDSGGNLWTITSGGIGRVENEEFKLLLENRLTQIRYLSALAADKQNHVWYGFYETIYQLGENGVLNKFDVSELTAGGIRSLMFDGEGNLWLGTNGDGLIRLRPRQIKTLSTADGLLHDEIITILEDVETNGVWIGSVGLTLWQNNQVAAVYKKENGLPANRITALHFDRDKTLWIGTLAGFASLKNGEITNYPDVSRPESAVKAIFADRGGNLWLGRQGVGLQLFQNGVFKTFNKENGLVNPDVRFIGEDRAGNLLIGTAGGLSVAKMKCAGGAPSCRAPESLEFTNFTTQDGLSNDFVRDIFEDGDGTLWIATYGGGLNRWRDGKFSAVTIKNGLGDDFISRILTDERGNFWLLGNRGVFSVKRDALNDFVEQKINSLICGSFGLADGMLSSEGNGGNSPAGWRMRDGALWFPMLKGIAIIDPQKVSPKPPRVVLEEILISGAAIAKNDQPKAKITLNPAEENLEIHFTALSFSKPEQIKFRYRLEGLDEDWINLDTRRAAYFPHLPAGNFKFIVAAASPDGVWSEETAFVEIEVLPPVWQRGWFVSLAVLCLIALVAWSYQLRLNQLQRRRAAQEEFSRRLITAHETERRRLASELHDGIGQELLIIKNWAALGLTLAGGNAAVREQLEEISATAGRALEDARHLARALRPFHLERFGLTKALGYMAEQIESSSGIRIETEIAEIDNLFSPEIEISVFRVVQEAFNNIVKHSKADTAELKVEKDEKEIRLKISDNGKGFEPENIALQKSGFGLMGISERVNLLNGRFSIDSAPGAGTKIVVTLLIPKKEK